jgi:hypothetical protein
MYSASQHLNFALLIEYSLVVFVAGAFIPLVVFLIKKAFPQRAYSLIGAYIINPLSCRLISFNIRDIGDVQPTRGQTFFVLIIILLNATLSGVRLYSGDSSWKWDSPGASLTTCLANRLGALSIANIPLVVLYGGRNNILLMITGTLTRLNMNSCG